MSFIQDLLQDAGADDNWAYKDVQCSIHIVTSNKPPSSVYRPDALPVTKPRVSMHGRELLH